jgi:hypothetical protein
MLLEAHTRRALSSHVEDVAPTSMRTVPPGMSAQKGGRVETKTDQTGQSRPVSTSFQVRVPITDFGGTLQAGMQGQARIYTGWQPLFRRIYRYCAKTFHFDL